MRVLNIVRDDVRRTCRKRHDRAAMTRARVVAPLATAVVAVLLSTLIAHLLGASGFAAWAIVTVTAVLAAGAAHRTLGSLAAGAGIRLAQPYRPGERVRLHLPSQRRVVEAEVVRVGAANTTLLVRDPADDDDGLQSVDSIVVMPNSVMLRGGRPSPVRHAGAKTSTRA